MRTVRDRVEIHLGDRYSIERELGTGGMATVFLATDSKHGRKVAIKVLRPEVAGAIGAERFLREIETLARLNHPHVLPLHDSGEAGGLPFYVMPFMAGESLNERLAREGALPVHEAIKIASECADALHYAHDAGVVHRDLKPANILLSGGHAVIADFGIAGALEDAAQGEPLTRTGVSLGSLGYMSPEQATGGRAADPRTDIYALACVLHETLTGERAFPGRSHRAVMARQLTQSPPSASALRRGVPQAVTRVVQKALRPTPADRFGSAEEFSEALRSAAVDDSVTRASDRRSARNPALVALAVLFVGALTWAGFVFAGDGTSPPLPEPRDQSWAFNEALPRIQELVDRRRMVAAHLLAREVKPYLEGNVEFERLLEQSISPIALSVRSEPPGARVSATDYRTPDGVRYEFGTTPLDRVAVPSGSLRLRVERPGFHPVERQIRAVGMGAEVVELSFDLEPLGEGSDMVQVPMDPAVESRLVQPPKPLEPFWLDRYEVRNSEFARFVEAGGYGEAELWREAAGIEGLADSGQQVVARFVDQTGRPGPSTWELGSFPEATGDHPVGGVSWYEATAYCRSVGKRLPTIHHWYKAAGLGGVSDVVSFSNLDGEGPAPVGSFRGVGSYGHLDMAGNVREWVMNPVDGNRYILGGAWNDSGYMYTLPNATSPLDRSPVNGFRCARFSDEEAIALGAETRVLERDFDVTPVDDERFERYRANVAYPPQPLNAQVDSVDEDLPFWVHQVVSFDAPYGSERVQVHLFLPKSVDPPYRSVVFYPGTSAFAIQSARNMETTWFDFLVRTGFAVVHPVYEGQFGREGSRLFRERATRWTMDIRRSIDYLEARDDFDADKVAFYGHSYGAWNGPIFTAMEPRFKASVFFSGGALALPGRDPELHPLNHAPRATVPALMVNGRNDFYYGEEAQRRLFEALGAPDAHKRHVMLEGGHFPGDWPGVMREIIDWLDHHLGPPA